MRLDEITPEQNAIVQRLIATNFENATPEEIELYAEWKAAFEMDEENYKREEELARERNAATIAAFEENAAIAKETLIAKRDYAKARLEELRKKVN